MNRKALFFSAMFMLVAFAGNEAAGQTNDVDMELVVKTSPNDYLFDETTMKTEEEALAESRNKLRPKIENETDLKNKEVTWQSIISAIVDNAPYLVKPRGEMKRALVYVKKDDLPVLIEKYKKTVQPAPIPAPHNSGQNAAINPSGDDEKIAMIKSRPDEYLFAEGTGANRGNAQSNARLQMAPHIRRLIAINYPAINATDALIKEISDDTEVIAVRQGNVFHAFAYVYISCLKYNLEQGVNSGRCDEEQPIPQPPANHHPETSVPSLSSSENGKQKTMSDTPSAAGAILEVILKSKTMNELYDILIPAKNKGKLVFGQVTPATDPDAYQVMYDHEGRIVNFYGPGLPAGVKPAADAGRRFLWFKMFE